jgi:septum formation protein
LRDAGWQVSVDVSGVQEIEDDSMRPEVLALENARLKWRAIAVRRPKDLIVAADTVVWFAGRFYGKPKTLIEAQAMLASLVGQTHEVVTGVVAGSFSEPVEFAEHSRVSFHELNAESIESYLLSINPLDKAGAYAAQGEGGRIIAEIAGLRSNVIGLPIERVGEHLGWLGLWPQCRQV